MVNTSTFIGIGVGFITFASLGPLGFGIGWGVVGSITMALTSKVVSSRLLHEGEEKELKKKGEREVNPEWERERKRVQDDEDYKAAEREYKQVEEFITREIHKHDVANLTPSDLAEIRSAVRELESYRNSALANGKKAVADEITNWINKCKRTIVFVEDRQNKERAITDAKKLISRSVREDKITQEKAEGLLRDLETGKLTHDSIKSMFGEL